MYTTLAFSAAATWAWPARAALAKWAALLGSGQPFKETQLLPEFLGDLFGRLLGYVSMAQNADRYTITREQHLKVDGKFADGVLGEFRPSGRQGVYGGYQSWINRAGRFRSLGDGQVDFAAIFSKLTQYDFPGWAVLEWECCIKSAEQGAREGAPFIRDHIITVTGKAFDDFASGDSNADAHRRMLGIA